MGRAGRRGRGLALYIAGEDALDQFFCRHPDEFLDRLVEAAILDLFNEQPHAAHLLCAAHEGPLEDADAEILGDRWREFAAAMVSAATCASGRTDVQPAARGVPGRRGLAAVGEPRRCRDRRHDLGRAARHRRHQARAHHRPRRRAVYPHGGRSYEVDGLDLEGRQRIVRPFMGDYYTQPKYETDTYIERLIERRTVPGDLVVRDRGGDRDRATTSAGGCPTTSRSTSSRSTCRRRRSPPRRCGTSSAAMLAALPLEQMLGSLHAAEHSQIAVLPLLAMCDRWDIGGLSTNLHAHRLPDDLHLRRPSRRDRDRPPRLPRVRGAVDDAHRLVSECLCESGCPSCVQSPKCGNLNEPLSKDGCAQLMGRMLAS